MTIGVVTLAVLAAGGGTLGWWLRRPAIPATPQSDDPKELIAAMASEDFAKLSDSQKQAYFKRLTADGSPREAFRASRELDESQRRQLRQNVRPLMEQEFERRIDEYFALPAEQQTGYLDEQIDQMLAMRKQFEARRAERAATRPARTQPSGEASADGDDQHRRRSGGRHRGPSAQRLKRRIEHTSPQRRAKFMAYMKAMHERMEQRGIEMRRPGRR
jgi:hypothetical protein